MEYENYKYGILGGTMQVLAWIGVGETPEAAMADAKNNNPDAAGRVHRISYNLYQTCLENGYIYND
jgi:hypothetical protein